MPLMTEEKQSFSLVCRCTDTFTAVGASEDCLAKPRARGSRTDSVLLSCTSYMWQIHRVLPCNALEQGVGEGWKICQNVATLTESWVSSLAFNRMYLSFTAANAESS